MPQWDVCGSTNPQYHFTPIGFWLIYSSSWEQPLSNRFIPSRMCPEVYHLFSLDFRFSLEGWLTYVQLRHLFANMGSLDVWLTIAGNGIHFSVPLGLVRISWNSGYCCPRSPSFFVTRVFHCWAEWCWFIISLTLQELSGGSRKSLYRLYFNILQSMILRAKYADTATSDFKASEMLPERS